MAYSNSSWSSWTYTSEFSWTYTSDSSSSESTAREDPAVYNNYFEYCDITKEEDAMIRGRLPSHIRPTAITRVINPRLWALYQKKKTSYLNALGGWMKELSLWHATSDDCVKPIVTRNFDYRLAERSIYGYGVCFSTDAGYSNFHCNHDNGDDRALILANVLVGSTMVGYQSLDYMPDGYDTAVDKAGLVFIKMDDHEFYPTYVVYYSNRFYQGDKTLHKALPVNIPLVNTQGQQQRRAVPVNTPPANTQVWRTEDYRNVNFYF